MFHRVVVLLIGLVLCGCAPSLEERVGPLLMVGFRGESVDESSPVVRDIREFNLGGVILF